MAIAAFAYWNDRIAPVFDTARDFCIVETQSGNIVRETGEKLEDNQPMRIALHLAELQLDVLVCGAISGHIQNLIEAYGIRIVPFVNGELHQIIDAWVEGRLEKDAFSMPGCGFQRRRHHRRGAGRGAGKGRRRFNKNV